MSFSKPTTLISASVLLATLGAASANFPYNKPTLRYTEWSKLDETAQNVAERKLGYTSVTWNVHGLADIEKLGWWQLTPAQIEAAEELGYTEDTWDCWIHHYASYLWSELEEYDLDQYYTTLGWTESSWAGETDGPSTEAKWWGQLTFDEKTAANKLCYFEDNWNSMDMNPNDGIFPFPKPDFRYVPWSQLSAVTQNTASGLLGYDEDSWNNLGTNIVEANTFLNLDEEQRDGILSLGFYTHTWDCFMNHYQSYYWSSLYGDKLTAVQTLGWTEAMWASQEEGNLPDSEYTVWADLTPEEKAAATKLCYFEETWNGEDLPSFYDPYAEDEDGEYKLLGDTDKGEFPSGGKSPGSAGGHEYTVAGSNASGKAIFSTGAMGLALSVVVYLFA